MNELSVPHLPRAEEPRLSEFGVGGGPPGQSSQVPIPAVLLTRRLSLEKAASLTVPGFPT